MYKIMSNHCTYSEIHYEALEPTILVEENVIWENQQENDNIEEQESVSYVDNANDTLTETVNESYMTADGDNTTQYFSVLDSTNQTILNDISNATVNNSVIHENVIDEVPQNENISANVNNGQVVLFRVDGSEDLFGFQLTHDEEGNLQKYQFKVRQNAEGNLEAIPETLQILPVDDDMNEHVINRPEQNSVEEFEDAEEFHEDVDTSQEAVFVKEEQSFVADSEEASAPEFDDEEIFEEPLDTKEGIIEFSTAAPQKQEMPEEEDDEVQDDSEPQEYTEDIPSINQEQDTNNHEEEMFYTHQDSVINENFYQDEMEDEGIEDTEDTTTDHYEELFVKESHLMDDTNGIIEENEHEDVDTINESDNEDYETVDGDHITGDDDNVYEDANIRKSPSYQRSTIASRKKVVKNVFRKVRIEKNDGKTNLYYLVKNTEKENMGQAPCNSITAKPNPRSILKCSLAAVEPIKCEEEEEEEKYDKRFAKSKEAQQARLFHNFIAQTKIIHAPVRQERLPRKQQIKPINRVDEEIVVQEVVVSSSGFIETSEEGVLKERVPLKPTEYIQLTDSDDDFNPRTPHKKKRQSKKRKPIEITISDSDDESSVKSVPEYLEIEELTPAKRPRGRPPKNHEKVEEKGAKKRPRGRPPKNQKPPTQVPEEEEEEEETEEIIVIKIDNKCPKCPKSFPSEGSLRSHMQYHNFSQTKSTDAKYICEKCGDVFKNSFLLNRHMNTHKTSNITCAICKKVFKDQAELIAHKRTHIKEQMFKTTNLAKDSPKPKRSPKKRLQMKCNDCGRVFTSASILNFHKKQHKRFTCQTCGASFISKFIFDKHQQVSCVKKKTPRKRFSLNVKKPSTITSRVTRQSAIVQQNVSEFTSPKPVPTSNKVVTNIKCDSCSMTFATYTSLFKHKVLKHGLDTPDKSILQPNRQKINKQKYQHSGVPPSAKLKNAYMGLRSKLEK